jgi:hypothetical protein
MQKQDEEKLKLGKLKVEIVGFALAVFLISDFNFQLSPLLFCLPPGRFPILSFINFSL